MREMGWIIALLLWGSALSAHDMPAKNSIALQFYSEQLNVVYNIDMLTARCTKVEEKNIMDFYRQLEKTDYRTLLDNLQQQQLELQLNDWLLFQLMRTSVDEIFQQKSELERELICWFLLSQAGFDTRLTYLGQRVFVYVYSNEEIFEVPIIAEAGRNYVNLTSISTTSKPETLYLLNFAPRAKGKVFSFAFKKVPKLRAQISTRTLHFKYKDISYQIEAQYDQTLVELMRKYPLIGEEEYLKFPMSDALSGSILPQLKTLLQDKSPRQSLELLVAFTRSCFEYKEDREVFGRSKPMIAEEVLYYEYSDCEDRSALFFGLVKELLGYPMVVLAYPNHITVGVALEEKGSGVFVETKGKRYYICDPTGPVNSAAIGIFPEDYAKMPFEIVLQYK